MNPEWKAKWVNALRSGEYKQAQDYLRTNDGYCCLGVICDLTDNTKWIKENIYYFYSYKIPIYAEEMTKCATLPSTIITNIGLEEFDDVVNLPIKDRSNNKVCLAELNDEGLTFNQIADLIEYFL